MQVNQPLPESPRGWIITSGQPKPPKWLRPFSQILLHFPNCPFLCPANWPRFTPESEEARSLQSGGGEEAEGWKYH